MLASCASEQGIANSVGHEALRSPWKDKDMLYGLDIFSGIGGLTLALGEWVRPIAYCERDRWAQASLLSLQGRGLLPAAPIWDDVTTLGPSCFRANVDIIYG